MKRLVARGFILFFAIILLSSCGFLIDESRWDEGHGELSDVAGDVDVSYDDLFIPDYSDFVDFNPVEEDVDYGEKTGEWFDGQDLGYGIPAGTMVAGDEYEIVLIGHDPDGVEINRDMRVQLHEIGQDYELGDLIMEEEIHVEEITGTEEIYTNNLPDKENVSYVVSLEVLADADDVEDTLVGLIYVPEQEVNAELSLDRDVFEYVDDEKKRVAEEVTLKLENYGPTFFNLGEHFTIEKLVEDTWRVVPAGLEFKSIGINLGPNDSYEQVYDVADLRRGTYRFVKDFSVDGIDSQETLAVEFTVE